MRKLFESGHTACAGCGMAIIVRHVIDVLGKDTIVVNATGCLEIVSSAYPRSAFKVPYIHCLFENTAAIATGIVHALKSKRNEHTRVTVLAGDGATYDIGFGVLSGMLERNEDVLYICYDNEAYMNTGNQRSGATPYRAATTTSPAGSIIPGKNEFKKPIVEIAAAHRIPYTASASIGFLEDMRKKIEKAKGIKGSRFIVIHSPCVSGWGYSPEKTIKIAKLAVETGLWQLYEIENGVKKINYIPKQRKLVREYFSLQKRFKHLNEEQINEIQKIVDEFWEGIANN